MPRLSNLLKKLFPRSVSGTISAMSALALVAGSTGAGAAELAPKTAQAPKVAVAKAQPSQTVGAGHAGQANGRCCCAADDEWYFEGSRFEAPLKYPVHTDKKGKVAQVNPENIEALGAY